MNFIIDVVIRCRRNCVCYVNTVEPQYNKPLYNKVLVIMNNILCHSNSNVRNITLINNKVLL